MAVTGASGTEPSGAGPSGAGPGGGGEDADPTGGVEVDVRLTPAYRVLRVAAHGLNRALFRTTVTGQERVPTEGPVIIAPVHRSFIDFFAVSDVTDRKLHYMAKDSLWKNPRFGRFLLSVGAFPVHRGAPDRESMTRAQQVLEAGEVLVLFPEGERRTGPVITDLHEGVAFLAARTGAAVVPVGVAGSATVMPKGQRIPRPRKIHLEVGEPLSAPPRAEGKRVPRSQVHVLTEALNESMQELYDKAVTVTGRY